MAMFGLIKEKSKGGKYPVDDRMFMQMVDNSDNLIHAGRYVARERNFLHEQDGEEEDVFGAQGQAE